jgi:hypothetical protein
MPTPALRLKAFALSFSFAASLALLAYSSAARADPPSRVARLSYVSGGVSFSPAGESDWDQATLNRPLTPGDRLWTDERARAEVQIGGATTRLDAQTGAAMLNLDDLIAQWQVSQGTIRVRVRRLAPGQVFEVDTPNLALTLRRPGAFRVEVDPDGDATTVTVLSGEVEVSGEDASYVVDARQPYRFTGTGLRQGQALVMARADEFDRWAAERDRLEDASVSARYVSPDVVGYQDLDGNGTWRVDASYGNVWTPSRVPAGWAPYRDGHWAWIDPWGWTWIDEAPWGFAVSHYGRWADFGGTWGWVPGPVRSRAYYAPALVVFIGGADFQITLGGGSVAAVGWFPLAPREVYRPSYPVSRGYFQNVNRSNTVVNITVIDNYYENVNAANVVYANRRVRDAVVTVPRNVFVQSQPVSRAAVALPAAAATQAAVVTAAPVDPTARSVRGAAPQGARPPARAFERPVVARTAPPAARAAFEARQPQPATRPGRPLDAAAGQPLTPTAPAHAPPVRLLPATPTAQVQRRPPAPETMPARAPAAASPTADAPVSAPVPAPTSAPAPAPVQPTSQRPTPDRVEAPTRPGREAPAAQAPRQAARPAPETAPADARPGNARTSPGQADRPQRPIRTEERGRPEPAASAASAARGRSERP